MKQMYFAAAVCAGLATATTAETWDMATPYSDATFHTQNIAQFAKDVAAATDGTMEITVHSAGSLFPHGEIKNTVRSGQIPMGEFVLSRLVNEDPAFGLDSQPFLATSYDDAARLWNVQKPIVTELLEKQGLMPLFSVPWPAQGLYTNGEVVSVEDLQGLRFRAYNAAIEEMATLAGAAPVQVEAPNIPQAFATGQVDAMITSPSTGANSKAWDFVTHYTPINAWVPKNIVVVNQRAFRRLPDDIQTAVLEAAKAAEARGWEMSAAEAAAKVDIMKEHGMVITEPSAELTTGLKLIGDKMLETWTSKASASGLSVLEAYQQ